MAADAKSPSECPRKVSDSCPSGHELWKCRNVDGYQCKQCSELSFQPNENWILDRCRLRKMCGQYHMRYKDHGSTTRDANCECVEGYHFENEDQRACVPNRYCAKGFGQGEYGVCIKCIDQHMYSDTNDRLHRCKPLTNCEKQSRCTLTKSNGTFDNICGPKVRDVKSCDDPQPPATEVSSDPMTYIIAGGICGSILFIFLILAIVFIIRRNSLRRRRYAQKPLSQEQLEELKLKIVKECERDSALCKKVLSRSVFVVEERIERQIWTLAQELYRSHPEQGKYELIVEKYKASQHKYAVNGYLQEWKSWRGETKDAVADIFRCLRHCKRDDIVYEICNGLRLDVGFDHDLERQMDEDAPCNADKHSFVHDIVEVFCPCAAKSRHHDPYDGKGKVITPHKEKEKGSEVTGKLLEAREQQNDLEPQAAGAIYRARPCPTAPVIDEGHLTGPDDVVFAEAHLAIHRQYSQPVQATT